ncbi:MAG TPA: tripartite tricarboxylate transporter substrate-binding protein [Xanthobacteraceae bacterium]|nr:tripartite tricarboxylate transporter substrate-binding protein [Xanthobacteraceae bacterium]
MLKSFIAIACVGCVAASGAAAQEFPSKNVTLMMPYAAGGPGDLITRVIGNGMSKALGKQFLVENTAGAGGTIGTAKVAASAPDGHSLLVMHFGHAANTALYPNLRYDAIRDFEPIGMIAESPMAFVAKKDFPAGDFKEFVATVKAGKDKVTLGHAGIGSASQLCSLLFLSAIDTMVTTLPYKGTAPALNDLLGGQFDFMCDQTLNVLQPVKAGMIKAYATTTKTRIPAASDLPTVSEAGLPGFEITVWFGMYAPKDTPKPVIDKLAAALQEALKDPDVKSRLAASGAETVATERATPEALRAHLKSEIDRWVPIIKKAGVQAE